MENITIQDILEATGGTLLCGDPSMKIDHLSTNSMEVGPNTLFVPIIGERVDAHIFIPNAAKEGAACLTQEHNKAAGDTPYIKVDDTLTAMQQIASYYRNKMSLPIIGVTGSVGKTTTREMIAHVLKGKYKVFETIGNQNSQVGVPLTLDHLTSEDEIGVLEMGMSEKGQITTLGNIIHPNVGVVTNVGVSHIENLGSREGILKAKCEMFESMEDGYKVLNGDDDMLVTVKDKYKNICYFSMNDKNAEVYADNIQPKGIEGISCTIHTKDVSFDVDIPVPGLHMVSNAMAATAIALKIGLNADEIKKGIESFVPTKMRMDIVKTDRYTIVNDVYNANPNSTKAGIDVVAPVEGKSCCILGDMLELGDFGPKLHSEVGQYAIEKNIDTLVCIGEISKSMYEGALSLRKENVYYFPTQEEFWEKMGNILEDGMTILIKASRGMHFEKTTERIKEIK